MQGNLTVLILSYYDAFPCGQGAPADDILCALLKVEARGRMRSDQRKLPRRRAGQRLLLRQPARLGDCVRGQGHQSYQDCVCGHGQWSRVTLVVEQFSTCQAACSQLNWAGPDDALNWSMCFRNWAIASLRDMADLSQTKL